MGNEITVFTGEINTGVTVYKVHYDESRDIVAIEGQGSYVPACRLKASNAAIEVEREQKKFAMQDNERAFKETDGFTKDVNKYKQAAALADEQRRETAEELARINKMLDAEVKTNKALMEMLDRHIVNPPIYEDVEYWKLQCSAAYLRSSELSLDVSWWRTTAYIFATLTVVVLACMVLK